ncbi:MAG: glycosyltransferase family 2 protein [candidate division KSB1 bacterium]|nr:glycosyltransferase family 2 protein [candidate division KSB1 bacterium]MDZ7273489.1 glycosyltransferase family 2 protein [candidate division KSB1 bacterium]MDZ7286919.1 glycosyltransferase family 2 protein [candidate division KSB1 bacterium]MDZ7299728.1 glycosyltransferase family 2 protein [candidate division KSB1 bacterium]MDZ7305667.1 glycosyltransferase family 2 protein [candidate division KSB1 bacterium]
MNTVLEYGVLSLYFIALAILFIFGVHGFVMVYYYKKFRRVNGLRPKPLQHHPKVTIQLPIFNEYYVVERLIHAVCSMTYPRERLQIQVLDDSTDETLALSRRLVGEYRSRGIDITLWHREQRRGFKAGALREGLAHASGEFIAIFDADFIPPRDFLMRTIPYFDDPQVGMVQTRWGHLNPNFSLLTRAQTIGLDGHFMIEQVARNGAGFFINFNGTAGIWRKSCILDAGNWSDDTLTEDLDLSYRAQLRGWKFKFLADAVCPAELPAEIGALKSQQFRWTKGAIETAKKIMPQVWRSHLPLRVKLQATIHLTNNLVFPFILLAGLLNVPLLLLKNDAGNDYHLYFTISSVFVLAFFGSFLMYMTAQRELYPDWRRRILYFPVFMAGSTGLAVNNTRAIFLGMFNRRSEFQRTPKYCIANERDHFLGKKYFVGRGPATRFAGTGIVEVLLAIYCLAGVVIALHYAEFAAIPFQLLFCCGFAYIGVLSLQQALLPQLRSKLARVFWLAGRSISLLQPR